MFGPKLEFAFVLVSRKWEEEVPGRAATIRVEASTAAGGAARNERRHNQGAGAAAEREAQDAHGARDAQAQAARGGLLQRAQRMEGAAQAQKTGKSFWSLLLTKKDTKKRKVKNRERWERKI